MTAFKSGIEWLGHDAFCIRANGLVIYTDPWKIGAAVPADLILITHDHSDHCSPVDIDKIRKDETEIVTVAAAARMLSGNIHVVKPGDAITVKGVPIAAVPAYNIGKAFHPKEAGNVGFILDLDGERIYHAGDTDVIPEMASIKADIALIPVSGVFVMTAEEAAEAVRIINPKTAIPMHVGRGIGAMEDLTRFQEKSPVPVQILSFDE